MQTYLIIWMLITIFYVERYTGMNKIKERIDFNFSYKDCATMDRIIGEYINDRENMYKELFLSGDNYTVDDIREYIRYFCSSATGLESEDKNIHRHIFRIQHFLQRNYEIYLIERVQETINNLIYAITDIMAFMEDEEIDFDDFEEMEYNSIENIKKYWEEFIKEIMEYPLLNLDKMEFTVIGGVQVYYSKNVSPFIYDSFIKFLENIKRDYPNTLLMMDTFILVPSEYIQFCAGKGTQAFFTDDVVFYADDCLEEDKDFVRSVYYHEFGHYIYSLLSETMMEYWHDCYLQWKSSNTKMTRDEDRNSQLDEFEEELFADTFSTLYVDNGEEAYIHKPSSLITDTLLFILEEEFSA